MNISHSGRASNDPEVDLLSKIEEVDSGEGNDFVSTSDSGTKNAYNDVYQRRRLGNCSISVVSDINIADNEGNNEGAEDN